MVGGGGRAGDISILSAEVDGDLFGEEFGTLRSNLVEELPGFLTFFGGEFDGDLLILNPKSLDEFSVFLTLLGGEVDGDLFREEFEILHSELLDEFSRLLTFFAGEVDGDLFREEFGILRSELLEEFPGFLISAWEALVAVTGSGTPP